MSLARPASGDPFLVVSPQEPYEKSVQKSINQKYLRNKSKPADVDHKVSDRAVTNKGSELQQRPGKCRHKSQVVLVHPILFTVTARDVGIGVCSISNISHEMDKNKHQELHR